MTNDEIRSRLFSLADEDYKAFHSKLIPTVDSDKIIGVRTPALRSFANEVYKSGDFQGFLCDLPHKYYDEDNLHAFLIEINWLSRKSLDLQAFQEDCKSNLLPIYYF